MAAVWESDLPSDEKFVALCLADFANDDGTHVYPSQETIARKVSKTDRAVRDTLVKLRHRGVITETGKHFFAGSRGATIEYRINVDFFRPEDSSARKSTTVPPGSLRTPARKPTSDDPPSDPPSDPPEREIADQVEIEIMEIVRGLWPDPPIQPEVIKAWRQSHADTAIHAAIDASKGRAKSWHYVGTVLHNGIQERPAKHAKAPSPYDAVVKRGYE